MPAPEHDERDVVRAVAGVLAESVPLAHDQGQDQGRGSGADFHHGAAGEVDDLAEDGADRAARAHEAAAPDHEGQRAVHQGDPQGTKRAQAVNFARSAMAPLMRATVRMANVAL